MVEYSYISLSILWNILCDSSNYQNILIIIIIYQNISFRKFFKSQVLTVYFISIAYASFDLCLCLMCIYIGGHFKILRKRFHNFNNGKQETRDCLSALKTCIQHHQSLILYVDRLENVFNLVLLLQVTVLSISICLVGYMAIIVCKIYLIFCIIFAIS